MVGNSVKLPDLSGFRPPAVPAEGRAHVIEVHPTEITTRHRVCDVADLDAVGAVWAAVIERHGINGNIAFGLVSGTGLERGALGTTIAHDSHNLIVVGRNPADMRFAAERLADSGGGAVAVAEGNVLAALELPIAGLMSTADAESVARHDVLLKEAVRDGLGMTLWSPVATLSFLALTVIPELRLTDMGLFDVCAEKLIPLFDA